MFVYQLLQRQIPRNSRALTARRLRNFVAFQQTLKHYLLHLAAAALSRKKPIKAIHSPSPTLRAVRTLAADHSSRHSTQENVI
jgi:hypothetical protein